MMLGHAISRAVARELLRVWFKLRISLALMHARDCECEALVHVDGRRRDLATSAWIAADRFRSDARRYQRLLRAISNG